MSEHPDRQMEGIARALRRADGFGVAFDGRVMGIIRSLPRHARASLWSRIARPRTITVRPAAWLGLAASLLIVASFAGWRTYRGWRQDVSALSSGTLLGTKKQPTAQRVQFVLVAPDAKKVAVVGDFNGWDANHAAYQAIHRGGGVWSVTIGPLEPDIWDYSFVADRTRMIDPGNPLIRSAFGWGAWNEVLVIDVPVKFMIP